MPADASESENPISFVRAGRPMSANKRRGSIGEKIASELKSLFREAGGIWSERFRYGLVYYFVRDYRPHSDTDADNISKPIWDALEGVAYDDDKVVRLRKAGVIEIGASGDAPTLDVIDLTNMPTAAARRFIELVEQDVKHIVYVELGWVTPDMFSFNLADRTRLT